MSDTFNIVVGDWSNDGHGHTDTQLISTVMTFSDIEHAWNDINRQMDDTYGFNLYNICEEYEDWFLTKKQSDAFTAMGINLDEVAEDVSDYSGAEGRDAEYAMGSDNYVELIIRLFNIHNPLLAVSRTKNGKKKELHVGGYGLFSD